MPPLLSLHTWSSGLWPEANDAEAIFARSAYTTDLRIQENLESTTTPYVAPDLDTEASSSWAEHQRLKMKPQPEEDVWACFCVEQC